MSQDIITTTTTATAATITNDNSTNETLQEPLAKVVRVERPTEGLAQTNPQENTTTIVPPPSIPPQPQTTATIETKQPSPSPPTTQTVIANLNMQILHPMPQSAITKNEQATTTQVAKRRCKCKSSKCIKLYCECFNSGTYCVDCDCIDCHNNEAHKQEVEDAIAATKIKKPDAFTTKSAVTQQPIKGCKCKNTNCKKNYCECFRAGILCGEHCRCTNCKNCGASKITRNVSGVQGSTTAGIFHSATVSKPQTLLPTQVPSTTTTTTTTTSIPVTTITPTTSIPASNTIIPTSTSTSTSVEQLPPPPPPPQNLTTTTTTILKATPSITTTTTTTFSTIPTNTATPTKKDVKTPLLGANNHPVLVVPKSTPTTEKKKGRPQKDRSVIKTKDNGGGIQLPVGNSNSILSPIPSKRTDLQFQQPTVLKEQRRITFDPTTLLSMGKLERNMCIEEALSDEAIKELYNKLMGHLKSSDVIASSRDNVSIPKRSDSK